MICKHCVLDCFHSLFVFRVRDVVREHTVRLQELASGSICTKRSQNFFYKETAGAIACIYNDTKTFQWFVVIFGIYACFDLFLKACGISVQTVAGDSRFVTFCNFQSLGKSQNLFDICFLKSAVRIEEFQTIAVEWKMACGDHNRTVKCKFREYNRHEHGWRRYQSAVINSSTSSACTADKSIFHQVCSDTGVMSNTDFQLRSRFAGAFGEPAYKCLSDQVHSIRSQSYGFVCDSFCGNTAHIAAVLQF